MSDEEEGIFDIIHKKCQSIGCDKMPSFGLEQWKPLFCLSHQEEEMLNMICKKCLSKGCDIQISNIKKITAYTGSWIFFS